MQPRTPPGSEPFECRAADRDSGEQNSLSALRASTVGTSWPLTHQWVNGRASKNECRVYSEDDRTNVGPRSRGAGGVCGHGPNAAAALASIGRAMRDTRLGEARESDAG